jgi:hypothetical protein
MAYGASKEVGNKKIKSTSNKKSNTISFNQSEGFSSKLMKNINFKTTDVAERTAIANEIVGKVLGLTLSPTQKSFLLTDTIFGADEKLEEIIINMKGANDMEEATSGAIAAIGEKLNIYKDKDEKNKYKFPIMLRMGKTTFLLQGIDSQINNQSFGKSVINSISGTGEFKTVGNAAKYVALPMELAVNTLSPIGFSVAESKRYTSLVNKKVRLDVSEIDIAEEMTQDLTPDMFEDNSRKIEEPLTKLDLDIQNINVTFDMVKHFYDQSTTRKSFDAYSTEFAAYAANLKTTGMTNQEIIEKLKCL